ncbi:hypothetical protein [Clostridium sp. OS1-26]|uniref:coiled-coil domain-containing protein n=1 Tax=Clostridium sp. OS1-26 TaxID=3070681 RepID=UPI0027E1CFB8|nr:hypothetical protein [Clostridium sp. OS1-26]WML33037.1 hypothetical protein RCG18_16970 [Clostridium sp. OS1-26]
MNTFLKQSILTLTISLLFTGTVYAEPVKNIENIQINIEKLDTNIEAVMKKIDDNNKQISDTENDIKVTEEELKDVESDLNKEKNLFNNRIRAMYINGFDSYLHTLLKSKDVKDLISNSDAVKRIVDLDASIINRYKDKKNLMSSKKKL